MMKVHIILMVWQLLVLKLEGLQRIPHTASGNKGVEKVDWDLCEAEVYNNLGGLGGRNVPGTDLSSGKKEIRYKKIGSTSKGKAIDLVITNTTEYVPNPRTPKAARDAGDTAIGGQYFNGRKDCVGVFNIDSPGEVTLKFSMVLTGTDTLAPEGVYDFTIFDWDKSEHGIVEQIIVQGIDSWVQGKATPIIDGDKYIFSALPDGIEVDNPSDPYKLTPEQIDASVGFVYKANEWEITFKAMDTQREPPHPGHPGGRNFHFAGRSQLQKVPTPSPTPSPTGAPTPSPCPNRTTVDWDVCNSQVYSNLGGLGSANVKGKGGALRKELRYDSIVKLSSGEILDLVITNTTEYVPNPDNPKAAREAGNTAIGGQYFNGRKDCLGVFNIMAPSQVTLKFSMVLTGTDTPVPKDILYDLTIYDFDVSEKGIVEQIVVQGVDSWSQRKRTPIVNGDTYTFGASPSSPEVDNPSDPCKLTEEQIDASVGFVYNANEWEITFKAIDTQGLGDARGRNFLFSGRSRVQDPCNVDRPLPPRQCPDGQ